MVEKEEASYADESTVMVDAMIESSPPTAVGAAIDALEAKLASKGIVLQFPTVTHKSDKGKVEGKLLRLPTLIHFAITHEIDTKANATERSVGERVTSTNSLENTLVPGNVVALLFNSNYRCPSGSFLRIIGEEAEYGVEPQNDGELPLDCDSERFLIVDAGNGSIAFYSPCHRRFLGCKNGQPSAVGYPVVNTNESPRANESFVVVNAPNGETEADLPNNETGHFRLHCLIEEKVIPDLDDSEYLEAFQIYGFD